MNLITEFDPWRSKLCTCPPKLTFNPYTGCDHECVYCYASSYIPRFHDCRPKKKLVPTLKREASKLKGETISISNSSDPYSNLEKNMSLTRKCLEVLAENDCRLQIITKSSLVARDIDVLQKVPSMVSLTITTDDDELAKQIEPKAPTSSERLKTAETLIEKGIPTSIRIDPLIPLLNDNQQSLIRTLAAIGVKHLTSSTYKAKSDNWLRLTRAKPHATEKLENLYFERGEKISGQHYLPRDLRFKLMKEIRELAEKNDMKFGTCRENLDQLNTAQCDGSWLLPNRNRCKRAYS